MPSAGIANASRGANGSIAVSGGVVNASATGWISGSGIALALANAHFVNLVVGLGPAVVTALQGKASYGSSFTLMSDTALAIAQAVALQANAYAGVIASGGAGASVGLASARPVATGGGGIYLCLDAPVMYVDDPTLVAWVQFNSVPVPKGPAVGSYTIVGAGLGLTQYADSILAQQASATANVNACALAAGSLPQASSWTVTLAAAMMIPPATFPGFGLCVSNGTASGTSQIWLIHVFGNGNSSVELEVITATVGGNFISSLTSFTTLLPNLIGNSNCLHFRILNDGNVMHLQYGNGQSWLDMYTLLSPAGLTNYGFSFGSGSGAANARAMATVFENTLGTITVPQAIISAAAPAGASTVLTTTAPHGLVTGDWVSIFGIVGLTGANTNASPGAGFASDATTVIVTGASTFTLPGVTTAGTYSSGGTVTCISR